MTEEAILLRAQSKSEADRRECFLEWLSGSSLGEAYIVAYSRAHALARGKTPTINRVEHLFDRNKDSKRHGRNGPSEARAAGARRVRGGCETRALPLPGSRHSPRKGKLMDLGGCPSIYWELSIPCSRPDKSSRASTASFA